MRIAYLINTYPMTSLTFVRREIEALEARGIEIRRFAVRRWAQPLVDPRDIAEAGRTRYLLDGNLTGLVRSALKQAVRSPRALARGVWMCGRLVRAAGGRLVPHAAYLLQAVAFVEAARAQGIAHVHVHFSTNGAAIALLAREMGGPTFSFTAHGPDEFLESDKGSLPLKLARAAFAVAISDFGRRTLLRLGHGEGAARIHVVRCGLDLADFAQRAPSPAASDEIVCIGRLCSQKGQIHLPAVAARLRAAFPKLRITLIGDGETRGQIEALIARHGVGDMVHLAGWRTNEEVRAALGRARGLILPSYAEGLPIVILEALALRRPVITTAIAGIPEIVDESCGWVVQAGCEDGLVASIEALMRASVDDLERLGEEGRARVEQRHDVQDLARTLDGLFAATSAHADLPAAHPARQRTITP